MVDAAYALIVAFIVIASALGVVGVIGAIFDVVDYCIKIWRKYKWLQRSK